MSLPRILEHVMAFFEDVVFIKRTQKPLLCSLKTKIFPLEKLYEKREGFLWADDTIS